MEFKIEFYRTAAELTVEGERTTIFEDIADVNGKVDTNVLYQLKEIVKEIEYHNDEISKLKYE